MMQGRTWISDNGPVGIFELSLGFFVSVPSPTSPRTETITDKECAEQVSNIPFAFQLGSTIDNNDNKSKVAPKQKNLKREVSFRLFWVIWVD